MQRINTPIGSQIKSGHIINMHKLMALRKLNNLSIKTVHLTVNWPN